MRDIILSAYERIAHFKIQNIEYFDVLASLKRLFIISVSLDKGAAELDMWHGASQLMRKDVHHMEGVYALLRERTQISIPEIEALISTLQ